MNTVFVIAAGAAFAGTLAAEEHERRLWVATQTEVAIDGDFSEWDAVAPSGGGESGYLLKAAWDERRVYLMLEAEGGPDFWEKHGEDYYNFGIDLKNDGDFSYEQDDFHFLAGVPDASGKVSTTLIRTGAASVETREVIQVAGMQLDNGYRWELALSVDELGGEALLEGRSLGFEIGRRGGDSDPMPFWMPVLWGDLALADGTGQLSSSAARRIADQQADMAERYRLYQTDPEKPEQLDGKARQDLERLARRFIELQVEAIEKSEVEEWLASQLPSGQWPEFEYGYTDEVSATSRMQHLYRLRELAYAREKMQFSRSEKEALLEAILRGMDFTIEEDLRLRNWYYNEIGYPLEFARIGLYLKDELDGDRLESILRVLKRAKRPMTGQNFIWINKVTMIRGLLEENPALVQRSMERIASMVRVEVGEGLQPDFSFHQHGSQLYSHGYGAKFVSDLTEVIYIAEGGRFQFPESKKELIRGMLLEGNRWMVRGTFADFGALGRSVSIENKDASYLVPVAQLWLEMDDSRSDELRRFIASAKGEGPDLLEGNRYFYRSEFMVHRREGFYASVKAYSKFLTGTESINGQGLKSYYLPDGATLFVRDGDEYADIQPVWDWRRVPGVTGIVSDEPIPALDHRAVRTKGNTDFVGGASDGWRGAAAYDYQRDGVSALKAYFGFDWGMVMLGAEISSLREEPLQTAVEQSFAQGEVRLLRKGSKARSVLKDSLELEPLNEPLGVWHDGALYYLPEAQNVSVRSESQSGSWRELRWTGSETEIERSVFSVTLSHGTKPRSESYEYAVIEARTPRRGRELMEAPPYRVLANDKQVQAVADAGGAHSQFVFHEAGRCQLPDGGWVAVSKPCVLLVSIADDEECVLTVADPTRAGGELIVELEAATGGKAQAVFHLDRSPSRGGESASMRIKLEN
ncbi:polysaccharide lyase family 8 super-sandwich domain-containing protein [Pelagicoccus sp. SDUM812005]|uniref:polysaccharide lyase family 8 super-sandwich domain-containing protein n=1 Tax=Pelagicoccus sp. SDUM812005 TaxID=3041257 RepID=UPI00280F0EFC|nr:polysaccharide lyase family 8 super-sandwich domain-containing protein [Pelagicoccus sp. SDUM812005]MDQ8181008.1 polysaccharide lyase family 8 super-sandwich domain-containing protein [Pelagicoccus sp. SDUM812005]